MTDRLYYDDAYLTAFDACVLECRPCGERWQVRLDRSAFYPTSGGQPFDTGTLGEAHVTDVCVEAGEVWHTVDAQFQPGAPVHGQIDWLRRFDHMQQHAADHMIAGALHRLMGGVTIGLHISDEVSTIDVSMPNGDTRIPDSAIHRIEADVNAHIQRDVPIRCWFPDAAELAALPLRKAPTVSEHVRIVAIGDDEMVACGGTHPSTAGQLGLVKILGVAPARGKMRVSFLAGRRALTDYAHCYDAAHRAAELFSTGVEHLCSSVSAAQERIRFLEAELGKLRRELLPMQAQQMLAGAERLGNGVRMVAQFVDADAALLREMASQLVKGSGVVALLGAEAGERAIYVFGRSGDVAIDMGALLRECAVPLGGKGGGKPDFAQGGGPKEILNAACDRLRSARFD